MNVLHALNQLGARLRAAVTRNFGLKALSLVLAVVLYMVVQRDNVKESELSVPLTLTNVPAEKVFVGEAPEGLKLRVRGRRGSLQQLLREHPARVTADLKAYRDGERFVFDVEVLESQLGSSQVEVLSVDPPSMLVKLEQAATALVPIEVPITGDPAQGFHTGAKGLQLEPQKVKVTGPASQVKLVHTVRSSPLDLHGADRDVRALLRLVPPGDARLHLSVDEVAVQVTIEERDVSKTLENQPIMVRGCPPNRRCVVVPAEVTVRAEGKERAVDALVQGPPMNLVFADLVGPRTENPLKLSVHPVAGVTLTVQPPVAKWSVLGESSAPVGTPPGR